MEAGLYGLVVEIMHVRKWEKRVITLFKFPNV